MRFRIPLLILALGAIVGLVFVFDPGLDRRVTDFFFDTATRKFPLASNITVVVLRDLNRAIDIGFALVIGVAVLWKLAKPERPLLISGRAILFLSITFLLAPAVMANAVFKENWSRPRPAHVTEYGGPERFVPWWDPRGTCRNNCSFVSGEVSAAAWTLAPAVLVTPPLRAVAVGAAIVFTGVIAIVRMAAGGHFLSDALFAALFTALIVWLVHELTYRRWRGWLTDAVLDDLLARFARTLRGGRRGVRS